MAQYVETLIVGAGLSGLHLASRLQQQQKSFLVVEARGRVGGRIFTDPQSNVDLGPAWFWPAHTNVSELINTLSLPVIEQNVEGLGLFQTGTELHQIPQNSGDLSFRIDGGMTKLIDAIASKIPAEAIQLFTAVTKLELKADHVLVTVSSLDSQDSVQIKCKHVALAIPPRLVAQNIEFEPSLPKDLTHQWHDVPTWMGGQAKAIVEFDKAFWRDEGLSGFAYSQTGPLVEIHDASTHNHAALFGFIGLPAQQRLSVPPTQLVGLVRAQIETLFKHSPTRIRIQDWAKEPLTSNELDFISPRYHPHYGAHDSSVWQDQVCLCSSENATQFGGYLEGAIIASYQAFESIAG